MFGLFSLCCPAAVGRLVQQLCGKRSDLPVDVPNEVVDDADRVILDTAHFLGGPRKRPLSSRTLSGSWAIDLWTSSTVVAPFSIASAMNLTRVFRLAVRSVDIAGSSGKELEQRTCLPPTLRGGAETQPGCLIGGNHDLRAFGQPENSGRRGFSSVRQRALSGELTDARRRPPGGRLGSICQ